MKDELSGKIMTDFLASSPKTYIYLIDSRDENEKAKGKANFVIKLELISED